MAENLNISSVSGGYQSQSERLVETYKASEQPRVNAIVEKKQKLEQTRTFFNSLYNRVTALNSAADKFIGTNPVDKFNTRKATVSDDSVVSVSANGDAIIGVSSVKVDQLASYDILVSDRFDLSKDSDSTFKGNALKEATYSFSIGTYGNGLSAVSVDITGEETNEELMTKIVNAINLNEDISITATLVKDTETTGRITFVSKDLGSNGRILFDESGDENSNKGNNKKLLGLLGVDDSLKGDSRQVFSDRKAGFKTSDFNSLNAKLKVNSIPITRSSNTIEDVLPGVTIELLKPQNTDDLPVTLTTDVDVDKVEELIKPVINSYNQMLNFLNQDKSLLRSDATISGLANRVRLLVSDPVTRSESDDFRYLTEIGIKINSDGTLTLSDKDKLKELLEESPEKVAHLFTSQDSFVNKILVAIENLTGPNGIIKSRTLSLADQIDTQVKRQEELEERIDREAQALRQEYESMLEVFLEAQSQFNLLGTMSTSDSSGYLSLLQQ